MLAVLLFNVVTKASALRKLHKGTQAGHSRAFLMLSSCSKGKKKKKELIFLSLSHIKEVMVGKSKLFSKKNRLSCSVTAYKLCDLNFVGNVSRVTPLGAREIRWMAWQLNEG